MHRVHRTGRQSLYYPSPTSLEISADWTWSSLTVLRAKAIHLQVHGSRCWTPTPPNERWSVHPKSQQRHRNKHTRNSGTEYSLERTLSFQPTIFIAPVVFRMITGVVDLVILQEDFECIIHFGTFSFNDQLAIHLKLLSCFDCLIVYFHLRCLW